MTALPTAWANDHVTTLRSSMTSKTQTAGITGNPLQHNTLTAPTVLWQITTAQILRFSKGKYVEYIYFATAAVDATTGVISWGTATRDITWKDGTITSLSTGVKKWTAGADVQMVTLAQFITACGLKDQTQTIAEKWTFSKGVRHSPFADATARNAAFPSPAEGDECFVTGVGKQVYSLGSWVTTNAAGTSAGSATASGTYEEGTVPEQAAHTATGSTGSRLVPAVANLVTLAGDPTWVSGAIPTLNTSKFVDATILGSGTPTAGKYLSGANTWLSFTASIVTFPIRYLRTSADYTTTSTTFVDIDPTNMTVDVVCSATTILFMMLVGAHKNSTAGNQQAFDFSVGGARLGQNLGLTYAVTGTTITGLSLIHACVPGAGTKTIRPQWLTNANTGTLYGSSGNCPASFIVIAIEP